MMVRNRVGGRGCFISLKVPIKIDVDVCIFG